MNENMENEVMMDDPSAPILPDGWTEDMDIFADTGSEDFFSEESAGASDTTTADEAEAAPTTEPAAETAEGEETAEEAPTTETKPETIAANKLRFKAKVDHQDLDVEVDEAELPTLYQKAQATDRAQQRLGEIRPTYDAAEKLARQMGYQSAQEMLDAAAENYRNAEVSRLVEEGVNEELARDYVNRNMENALAASGSTPNAETAGADTQTPEASPVRDYTQEAGELLAIRPGLRGKPLPDEVMREVTLNGKPLVATYLDYEAKQKTAEIEKLRKENDIYKQNAEAAARSPVTGTDGGGATDTKPSDPFMTGFDSGW